MFANFLHLFSRRSRSAYETEFVEEVRVRRPRVRNRKVERLIWICWGLIALKSAFVIWAVHRYHIPFDAMWVVIPTIAFATLCTGVYFFRRR